jgi:hypothetical protein
MNRFLPLAATLAVAVAGAAAAPAPKAGDGPPPYYPTVAESKATYQTTIGDLKFEHTERVTEVAKVRDGFRVTVERASAGKPAVVDQMDVSAKGLTQRQYGGRAVDPPTPELRLPAKAGDTWEWEAPGVGDGPSRKITFKVIGEEEVEVPAGKFKAVRVERELEVGKVTQRSEGWYAPEVGLVKKVFHHLGAAKQVQELKSFTPGKK